MQNYIDELIAGLAIYFFLVATLTFLAKDKKAGQLKVFLISLLFTPITGLIVYLTSKPLLQYKTTYECPECHFEFDTHSEYCPLCEFKGKKVELVSKQIIDHP